MKSTQVPHAFCVTQPVEHHVCLWRNRHPKIAQIHRYTHGLDISLMLCSQLPPQCLNHWAVPDSSPHRYSTHILSDNHYHHMCLCVGIGTRKSLKCMVVFVDFTTVMLSTWAKVLQSLSNPWQISMGMGVNTHPLGRSIDILKFCLRILDIVP